MNKHVDQFKMESFKSDDLKQKAYRDVFLQEGGNVGIEYLLNSMSGEGLANYFGTSIKTSVPVTANTIKGAKSNTKTISLASGIKRKPPTSKQQVIVHRQHKKGRWPNL
jgi:hypothetical protein